MPTTSNFGWTTPADTDLVKDGAAAIRTLGNGVDTSFVDLKGGTTGQILSKATNTDLDFTWIANDQGDITEVQAGVGISVASGTGPIPVITNSSTDLITTAGDLLYGTAADTVARLGIGTAGQVLKVNSGATAPEWGAAGSSLTLSQIATGSLTSGTSVTISSLSSYDFLQIQLVDIDPSASSGLFVRINGDNSGLYAYSYFSVLGNATAANVVVGGGFRTATDFRFDAYENINPTTISNNFQMTLTNCKSAGFTAMSGVAYYIDASGSTADRAESYEGIYRSAAAVSSLVISLEGVNTFQAGTYYIYGG